MELFENLGGANRIYTRQTECKCFYLFYRNRHDSTSKTEKWSVQKSLVLSSSGQEVVVYDSRGWGIAAACLYKTDELGIFKIADYPLTVKFK
jgi:hypothetical protein